MFYFILFYFAKHQQGHCCNICVIELFVILNLFHFVKLLQSLVRGSLACFYFLQIVLFIYLFRAFIIYLYFKGFFRHSGTKVYRKSVMETLFLAMKSHLVSSLQMKHQHRTANVTLVTITGWDFTRITAFVLYTVQWKHLNIAIVLCKYHFNLSKNCNWNTTTESHNCCLKKQCSNFGLI